ncbi:MAG: type II toxin-antitoxin system RelE/ParE family toxin, partial [Alphaproteobacteria bacterium]|nr:type II toxin-antitoxin system RelE/ParE family toxin [Alphaproteobacteria bacterium]
MTYSVSYLPIVAEKDIPKLPVTMRERIATAIEQRLTTDPLRYGKPLQFNLKGHRQLRVGDYR